MSESNEEFISRIEVILQGGFDLSGSSCDRLISLAHTGAKHSAILLRILNEVGTVKALVDKALDDNGREIEELKARVKHEMMQNEQLRFVAEIGAKAWCANHCMPEWNEEFSRIEPGVGHADQCKHNRSILVICGNGKEGIGS